MENLVITFKYKTGDINQIMSTADFQTLIEKFGLMEVENILLDDKQNCLNVGVNPDKVLVDVYEDAKLVAVESEMGTLDYFLGRPYTYKVDGKKLNNFLTLSN